MQRRNDRSVPNQIGLNHHALHDAQLSIDVLLEGSLQFARSDLRDEAEPTVLGAEDWGSCIADHVRSLDQRAIATNRDHEIRLAKVVLRHYRHLDDVCRFALCAALYAVRLQPHHGVARSLYCIRTKEVY